MAWIDKVITEMKIQTGDGRIYTPNWMNPSVTQEYNVSEFEFPEISGTLVDRRKPKGRRFPLEIYFQGENHLDQASNFMLSAEDNRPWTITHPIYDILVVQPISIALDQSQYNVSKFTLTVIETITDNQPRSFVIVDDKVEEDVELINEKTAESFATEVTPTSDDKNKMTDVSTTTYAQNKKQIKSDADGLVYFNALNTAQSAIINATIEPNNAMLSLIAMLQAPSLFTQSVDARVKLLKRNFDNLKLTMIGAATTLATLPRSIKKIYESNGAALLGGLALASVKNISVDDYSNRKKVADVVEVISAAYNEYLANLDEMQSGTGGNPLDYIPDPSTIIDLTRLVNFTMGNLFNLALNAKQERIFVLEYDSDIITLAHRLYGVKPNDSTIDELIKNNEWSIVHHLQLNKGEEIRYYV
jgi:hypothetical protein